MSCPLCIAALAGTDGIDFPTPNKTAGIGAAVGAAAGYLLVRKHPWVGLAAGAALGYLIAPKVAGSVPRPAVAPASPASNQPPPPQVPPPGGRPPVTSTDTTRLLPQVALPPPAEIAPTEESWTPAPF